MLNNTKKWNFRNCVYKFRLKEPNRVPTSGKKMNS